MRGTNYRKVQNLRIPHVSPLASCKTPVKDPIPKNQKSVTKKEWARKHVSCGVHTQGTKRCIVNKSCKSGCGYDSCQRPRNLSWFYRLGARALVIDKYLAAIGVECTLNTWESQTVAIRLSLQLRITVVLLSSNYHLHWSSWVITALG